MGDGRPASTHDEDCNPCTIVNELRSDGDRDFDLVPSTACSNPWLAGAPVPSCNLNVVRLDVSARRTYGADCDDTKRALLPGAQVCAPGDSTSVRVCLDVGVAGTGKQASVWESRKCPGGGKCISQPNGLGVCVP